MGESNRYRCALLSLRTLIVALPLVIGAISNNMVLAEEQADKAADKPASGASPRIVCLHTEFLPPSQDEALKYRLMRELGRQALLLAARDELGLGTRDETLGEAFPESVTKAKQDVFVAVRGQYNGSVRLQVWPASKPEELEPTKKEKGHSPKAIQSQTEKLEPMIRGELREKLTKLGFDGKVPPANEKNLPPDAIEGQLLEMNFVSQFAAVRAAHAAIAEKGQSRAWLAVLARGYANLALTTEHHWKSDTEVFAARALLYAERSVASYPNDSLAHADRAYVRAVVGLHGAALDELQQIEELRKQHPELPELPNWYELVEPYCSFEREQLESVGERRASLRQLSQRLSFEQVRAFGDGRWLFDSAKLTMMACPEEYGVSAVLASGDEPLSVGRTGAYYAPSAMAHFLPHRLAELSELPRAVRDAASGVSPEKKDDKKAKEGDDKSDADDKDPTGPPTESAGEYAAGTIPIVAALRAATRSGDDKGEPSWSALGELIFEEQFVQAANLLNISMNATESSHEDEVKAIMPAIKGHRYQRHIESYAVNAAKTGNFMDIIGDMQVVDPRGNMRPMLNRIWYLKNDKGHISRGYDAAWFGTFDRSLTFNGMYEAFGAYGNYWWNRFDASMKKRWTEEFQAISPHSPSALRFEMALSEKPSFDEAVQWESRAGEDPRTFSKLGAIYASLEHFDDAIRAYERSIKLSPGKEAFVGLANTYRAAGQGELWQPTLERFFEVESLGLEHAVVHSMIANDLIDKGKLEDAKPHAEAAAETYSEWGLQLASRVEEALGHWDESEKWIRAASTSYPSGSGDEWYFWCRRTGRGDLDDARKLAKSFFSADWVQSDVGGLLRLFTFHIAEDDTQSAYTDLIKATTLGTNAHGADEDLVRAQVQTAIVARELKQNDASKTAIKEARRLTEQFRVKYPHLAAIYTVICDVLEGKPPADEALVAIDKEIDDEPPAIRVNCQYFLGRAFDLADDHDHAEKYWKQCVTRGPFERYPATLAGKYLSDRHKTSRP